MPWHSKCMNYVIFRAASARSIATSNALISIEDHVTTLFECVGKMADLTMDSRQAIPGGNFDAMGVDDIRRQCQLYQRMDVSISSALNALYCIQNHSYYIQRSGALKIFESEPSKKRSKKKSKALDG